MRRLALIFIIAPYFLFAQTEQNSALGLSAYLLEVKYNSESHLATQIYFTDIKTNYEKLVVKYNDLRTQVDALVVQIQSEMIVKNKPLVYKKVNNALISDKPLSEYNKKAFGKYLKKIKEIDARYEDFITSEIDVDRPSLFDGAAVASLIGTAVTAGIELFKNIKETKMKKVTSLNAILETLKLQSSVEIMKQIKELKAESTD